MAIQGYTRLCADSGASGRRNAQNHPDTVFPSVFVLEGIADLIAEIRHIAPIVEKSVLLAEIVDHRIELCFEVVRVVVGTKFVPSMKESAVG